MPPRPEDESRLEQSKMSFGEHLEELRRALFKSIAALFIGFLVGMAVANDIVAYVQTPVRESLERFYMRQTARQQEERVAELKAQGRNAHEDELVTYEDMQREGLVVTEYLIEPQEFRRLLEEQYPQLKTLLAENDKGANDKRAGAPLNESVDAAEKADMVKADAPNRLNRSDLIELRLFQPIEQDSRLRVVGHSMMEPFSVWLKAAFISGLVFSSPFIFYFIWEFVAAGLYKHEQSYIYTYMPISIGLFIGGALLAFFFAFEPLLDFMFWYYERTETQPDLNLSEWVSFVLMMPLGFGISFQLPLLMLLLERIGIFTVDSYWSKWRLAVVIIMVIAMILTPSPDPYSMLLMGVPLVGLYFGGIWLCKLAPGRRLESPGDLLARRT
ncbi:MAG: twin-arginine translocase subunit TatC [Planctomycetaceae bacterium]|nr:twin-arginine translocase subunit TatC [Planctomycetaceae bacterium]